MATFVQKIPSEEQEWLSDSFIDPNGRVFQWRGEIYAACNEKVEAANPVSHNLDLATLVRRRALAGRFESRQPLADLFPYLDLCTK